MNSFNRILSKIEQYSCAILLLFITALLFVNVVLRHMGLALDWVEEFSRYGIIWITFVGSSICIYKGAHIGVDAITTILRDKGKNILSLITVIISIIFTLLLTIKSFYITKVVFETGQVSSTLEVPMVYIYGAMPVGGVLMLLRFIQQFFISVRTLKRGEY
ncbi:TRAP-type C4-dicarboxylate transport system, small permease component [Gottschalkia purinilytica]|uniref:TRAP-type C4-dicarboxylate transport system, small permease component n=1 Tax=Gottschalkia purinilytica TaxID=1503 RepID=A0A0L0WDY6_GOTPU|nr:TRAP transporter small permease [Gottschalkia purinilytica]KNF09692.1 TRAP-type C4-dicarboxylate transport system, small permease component [Gottschalkia purinilytica]